MPTRTEMEKRINITVKDHIADVKLNRPDKMNALDPAMFEAIIETGDEISKNGAVRCVVLSGLGKAFCAGLDLSSLSLSGQDKGITSRPLADRTHGIANKFQQAVWTWRELPVPVIAAVHGVAFGGGLQIILGADIRYITADARLSILEMKWGIIPDMGSTQLMRHLVRDDIIRELTYTNRIFSGKEAVAYGFATHLSEQPYEDAMELAKIIASKNPSAIEAAKRVLNKAPYLNQAEGLLMESVEQDKVIGKPNQMEAMFAAIQKRKGNFENAR